MKIYKISVNWAGVSKLKWVKRNENSAIDPLQLETGEYFINIAMQGHL